MYKILVIDDDKLFLNSIRKFLEYQGYNVTTCLNPLKVENLIINNHYNCVLLDVIFPEIDGIDLLHKIKKIKPHIPVIMVSGQSTTTMIVSALKKDAYDFIEKPIDIEKLLTSIKNAINQYLVIIDRNALLYELKNSRSIIGKSKVILDLTNSIKKIAPTNANVLITGEMGTGKNITAVALHSHSKRYNKPFIKFNCASIQNNSLGSELFGHIKGAFIGATSDKEGVFPKANSGTLFINEIADLNMKLQAKLATFFKEGYITQIGSIEKIYLDIRVIASTSQNLKNLVKEGLFRSDLYHQISIIQITTPSLRKRQDDIPLFAQFLLKVIANDNKQTKLLISNEALLFLSQQTWPGNMWELRNVLEKATIIKSTDRIELTDIRAVMGQELEQSENSKKKTFLKVEMDNYERKFIIRALKLNNGKKLETANILGINRSALFKKMRKFGITDSDFK